MNRSLTGRERPRALYDAVAGLVPDVFSVPRPERTQSGTEG